MPASKCKLCAAVFLWFWTVAVTNLSSSWFMFMNCTLKKHWLGAVMRLLLNPRPRNVSKVLKKQWFSASYSVPHEPFLAVFLLAHESIMLAFTAYFTVIGSWVTNPSAHSCSFVFNLHLLYHCIGEWVSQYKKFFFLLLVPQRYFQIHSYMKYFLNNKVMRENKSAFQLLCL